MPAMPEPTKTPAQVDYSKAVEAGDESRRRAALVASLNSTNKTSPSGISDPATIYKKTLLGQ